jgi:NAD(P)H-dependent flavin oxidoreductase YrpB (nitropropane dioxygenase family)
MPPVGSVSSGKATAERMRFVWPDSRLIKLLKIEHPIILAPMAGAMDADLVVEVSEAGGLGSLPCAMLTPELGIAPLNVEIGEAALLALSR